MQDLRAYRCKYHGVHELFQGCHHVMTYLVIQCDFTQKLGTFFSDSDDKNMCLYKDGGVHLGRN